MKSYTFGLLFAKKQQTLFHILCVISVFLGTPIYAQQIESKTIKAEFMVKEINRTGTLTFRRTVNLSFKSSGYLKELNIDEGERFTKGLLLAALDSTELIAEKNASYARLLQAKREIKRIKTLLSKKLSSQQALDDAKTLVETTRASHNLAQFNLSKAQIIAPFDGVVLSRFTELGELQNPNKSALQLAATENNLVVRVALTAAEVKLIRLQQIVSIDLAQFGVTTGVVSKIPAMADQQSHLFTIEILLENVNVNQVVVGQLAKLSSQITTNIVAYRIPIEALNGVDSQGRAIVMIVKNNAVDANSYEQQSFEIMQLSNEYIYLSTQQGSPTLNIITRGWQQLAITDRKIKNEDK